MTKVKMQLVLKLGYFMLHGNTYDECADEFLMKRGTVQRLINEKLKLINTKMFDLIKNKPYMVFQRAVYRKCSIEEARKVFHVSKKNFDKFLMDIYYVDPKQYMILRNKLYQAQVEYSPTK